MVFDNDRSALLPDEPGPLVGETPTGDVRLPESALRRHALLLGRTGVGKSTMIKRIIAQDLECRARPAQDGSESGAPGGAPGGTPDGVERSSLVVIDPHGDLVRDLLALVPAPLAPRVRLLDFGAQDGFPGINLLDPGVFPDREGCVESFLAAFRNLWGYWGNRLDDLLRCSLLILYDFNAHRMTERCEQLTLLDLPGFLGDSLEIGSGPNSRFEASTFQRWVMSRVSDPTLNQWFSAFLRWPRDTRAEAVGPIQSRIGSYANHGRAGLIVGQRESTFALGDFLAPGEVLLVSTGASSLGAGPSALLGGMFIGLVDSALREQALRQQPSPPVHERARCLLVCEDFQMFPGTDWLRLLYDMRKYGCSMMLSTQTLGRLGSGQGQGILGSVGCMLGYQMGSEDARMMSAEMGSDHVQERDLVNLDSHHCIVRVLSDTRSYPAFGMRTLPPPEAVPGSARAILDLQAGLVGFREARERIEGEHLKRAPGGSLGGSIGMPYGDVS